MNRPLVALALCGFAATALGQADELKRATGYFDYGEYRQAAGVADTLLDSGRSMEQDVLINAYRISGLAHFYLGEKDKARAQLLHLLTTDPDYTIDPFSVSPAARDFFDQLRKESEEILKPIRDKKLELQKKKALEEEQKRREREGEFSLRFERRVLEHSYWLNLLPLGVAQFDQGRYALGALFAILQLSGIVTSIASYVQFQAIPSPYSPNDLGNARLWRSVNWGSLAIFVVAYGGAVAEAIARYDAQTVSIVPVAPEKTPSAAPPIKASFAPLPGGGIASLTLSF